MIKVCPCCKNEKDIEDFPKDKSRHDGKYIYCKVCCKEKDKTNYHLKLEHSRLLKRFHSQNNKESRNVYFKKYYLNNKEKIVASVILYRSINKELLKSYYKQWSKNNISLRNEYSSRYSKSQKGKKARIQHNHNRKARERGASGKHSLAEWEALKILHNYTCLHCNKKEPEIKLTRDHIVPISKGGDNFISNIQPLCQSCNSKKHNKYEERISI